MEYSCHGKILTFQSPRVMAIINLTPDSFYDGGRYSGIEDILRDAEEKIRQGASILDLGAASSRPGAKLPAAAEEWERLAHPLREIRKRFPQIFLSVDTWQASIAERAAGEGADIINDISGGELDQSMLGTICRLNLPYVLMHMQGTPETMQQNPRYDNVETEVNGLLLQKARNLKEKGFEKIILDPGFGFGKDTPHNFRLLKALPQLSAHYPVLAGLSRKSMINRVIGTNPVTALNGTTVLNTIALMNGARILRVHDVAEAVQAIQLTEYYKNQ